MVKNVEKSGLPDFLFSKHKISLQKSLLMLINR